MIYEIPDGEIEFFIGASFGKDKCPENIDQKIPNNLSRQVKVDPAERAKGYVSLMSENVNIMANNFKFEESSAFRYIGWSNIITRSSRAYVHEAGSTVTELVDTLPTWDRDTDDKRPFYFKCYFSSDLDDASTRPLSDVEYGLFFNDAPMMSPSYGMWKSDDIDLGLFEIPSKTGSGTTTMKKVVGDDAYILCLTIVDKSGNFHVAWWITWTVGFDAKVERLGEGNDSINVVLSANSVTALNASNIVNPISILNAARGKQCSVLLKKYVRKD